MAGTRSTKEEIYQKFGRYVSSGKPAFFKSVGIEFSPGKREGAYLWDIEGDKKLIDCHCNGGVFNLGHKNPEIIGTLVKNLQDLDIGNHHLVSQQRAMLAENLANLMPEDINYSVFGVGGGEAIDLAIKVARGFTGRRKGISAIGGYHGHTGLALAAGDEKYRSPFNSSDADFEQIPFNDLESLEKKADNETAAILLETIPATFGISVPSQYYLEGVRAICDKYEIPMIMDEVQTGLGRTGKLWGFEHYNVVPDMVVIGKGLSGGIYPITATCFKDKYEKVFHEDPFIHVSTFGGSEVGCMVALKVLDISSDPEFLKHVLSIADIFRSGFDDLRAKHPEVLVGLRQVGMMMGIEMVNHFCGPMFSKIAYDNDFLSVYANNDPRIAQLLPPLIIDEALAGEILERVDRSLGILNQILGQA